jgi:hypothetical protein
MPTCLVSKLNLLPAFTVKRVAIHKGIKKYTTPYVDYNIEQKDNVLFVDAQGPFCEVTAK